MIFIVYELIITYFILFKYYVPYNINKSDEERNVNIIVIQILLFFV